MPFSSQAQAHWAFATGQPWAKRWARETGPYKKLPKRVKRKASLCMDCVLASLKGEQIAPGITRIRGNLCNVHGRYGPCDGAVGGSKRAAKPKGGKRVARQPAKRAAGRGAKPKQPTPEQARRQAQRDAEHQQDREYQLRRRAQVEQDREARLQRQAARETERQQDRAARAQRQAEADKKRAEQAKKPAASSGSGKKKPEPRAARQTPEQRRESNRASVRQQMADTDMGLAPAGFDNLVGLAAGRDPDAQGATSLIEMGLAERGGDGTLRLTYAGREAVNAANRGDAKAAIDAISRGRDRKGAADERQTERTRRNEERAQREAERQQRASTIPTPTPARVTRTRTPIIMPRRSNRGIRRAKAFAVFKDATGAHRWISRTTTAFEDRDDEVISTQALEVSARSDAPRGPLRWWHMGRPDPLDAVRPWGPGVDLGWCDFAAVSGRTLIESGTFKTEAIARAVAAHADDLELSPGFFHAAGEPDASGVFSHIRIFERSLVPKWAGRASNRYTGLVVEKTMDQKKIQALKDLGASDDVINALLADVQATEKAAEAEGVRYKAASPVRDFFVSLLKGEQVTVKDEAEPVAETTPEPEPVDPVAALKEELAALRAEVATLKADGFPPAEEEKQGEPFAEEPAAEEPMMEEEAGGLTLSSEDLSAIGQVIAATLEPLIGALGITQKLEGHLGELKTMMSGYVKTKDDAQAALVARLDQAEAKVADLAGEAPRQQGYRASTAPDNTVEALAAAVAMKDGTTPTADSPFADIVQHLFAQQR